MYGDIYNFPAKQYEKALQQAVEQEAEQEGGKMEYVEAGSDDEEAATEVPSPSDFASSVLSCVLAAHIMFVQPISQTATAQLEGHKVP